MAALLWAQQFKFDLDHLASKANNTVDVSLNKDMLQFAGKFLSSKDPDEAKARALIAGLEGIYIKSFEFAKDGAWTQADLDQVRGQLKAPQWGRIVGVKSTEDQENVEVFVRNEAGKVTGIAILATEPREFTVANIVGNISLESLADLGGQFGTAEAEELPNPIRQEERTDSVGEDHDRCADRPFSHRDHREQRRRFVALDPCAALLIAGQRKDADHRHVARILVEHQRELAVRRDHDLARPPSHLYQRSEFARLHVEHGDAVGIRVSDHQERRRRLPGPLSATAISPGAWPARRVSATSVR